MNLFDQDMNITILLLLFINIVGYIYSYLIVSNKVGNNKQIQPSSDRDLEYLKVSIEAISLKYILYKLGPILLGPFSLKEWQVAHFLEYNFPSSISAVFNLSSIFNITLFELSFSAFKWLILGTLKQPQKRDRK